MWAMSVPHPHVDVGGEPSPPESALLEEQAGVRKGAARLRVGGDPSMWPAWSPVTLASHRTCRRSWLRTHALVRQPWAMGVRAERCRQWFLSAPRLLHLSPRHFRGDTSQDWGTAGGTPYSALRRGPAWALGFAPLNQQSPHGGGRQ